MRSCQTSDGADKSKNTSTEKKFSFSGKLNGLGKIDSLPGFRFRWNTNEEVFIILTNFQEHKKWTASEVKIRPPNGSLLLYDRINFKTRAYHNDKYYWKTRKNSKSSRVDHSSLRIRGVECIYCSYVHSALVPTFHRRCYWLLENPDIVLVHYLNLPDKKASQQQQLISSLLPYKDMPEQELLNQLQPILANSGHEENNNKFAGIDIKELISEVKRYKDLRSKETDCKKKATATNASQTASSSLCQLSPRRTKGQTSERREKCSNCNRHVHVNVNKTLNSSDSSPVNTNVSVTINRQNNPQFCSEPPPSTDERTPSSIPAETLAVTDVSCRLNTADRGIDSTGSSHKQSSANQRRDFNGNLTVLPGVNCCYGDQYAMTSPHRNGDSLNDVLLLGYDGVDLIGSGNQFSASQSKDINDNLLHSSPRVNDQNDVTGCVSVTSQLGSCIVDSDYLVLDYDGVKLMQTSPSGSDLTNDLDMNLFDGDFLDYLPDYFINDGGLQSDIQKPSSPNITPESFSTLGGPIAKVSSSCSARQRYCIEDVISMSNSTSGCTVSGNFNRQAQLVDGVSVGTVSGSSGNTSCQITDVVSTNCHTSGHIPSLIMESNYECLTPAVRELGRSAANVRHHPSVSASQVPSLDMTVPTYLATKITLFPAETQTMIESVGQLPEQDDVCTDHILSRDPGNQVNDTACNEPRSTENESVDIITEFSPEWAYCDGRTKVLILGQWLRKDGSYSCLFDGCSVPATLIQSGVLRCFCPPHEAGLVALQVAWNGFIVSNACVFEYKTRDSATNSVQELLGMSDADVKKRICDKIERLEAALGITADLTSKDTRGHIGNSIEDGIVRIIEVLLSKPCLRAPPDMYSGFKGLTLLHLAAALGYTKLIQLLRHYACSRPPGHTRTGSSSDDVIFPVTECEPQSKDCFGCTPLMWACYRGHEEAALALLAWQPSSYDDCDSTGRSPNAMALESGHADLAQKMEEFVSCRNSYPLLVRSSPPPSPSSSCGYLSVSSFEQMPASPMSGQSLVWQTVDDCSENSPDFEMASVTSEDRPNTLGKVLVEIRTLIHEAEERARSSHSPLQTPDDTTPFSVGFSSFADLPCDDKSAKDPQSSESRLAPRTPHYDTFSIDSSPGHSSSTRSPGSPSVRNSPRSTGTDTSEFEEFLSKPRKFLERDFSELTLTDSEQQELLQAAKVIQNAYRQFKIRKKQHVDELKAAVLIQSYYRRYKQFASYKKLTRAAVLIQNSYRAHKEHEQFKKSRHAAAIIQNYFRHYRKRKQRHAEEDAPGKRLGTKYRKSSSDKL